MLFFSFTRSSFSCFSPRSRNVRDVGDRVLPKRKESKTKKDSKKGETIKRVRVVPHEIELEREMKERKREREDGRKGGEDEGREARRRREEIEKEKKKKEKNFAEERWEKCRGVCYLRGRSMGQCCRHPKLKN